MDQRLESIILDFCPRNKNIYDHIHEYIKTRYPSDPSLSHFINCPFCDNLIHYASSFPLLGCKSCTPNHTWTAPVSELYPLGAPLVELYADKKFPKKVLSFEVLQEYSRIYIDYFQQKSFLTESESEWIINRLGKAERGQCFISDDVDLDVESFKKGKKVHQSSQIKQLYLNAYFASLGSTILSSLYSLTTVSLEHLSWMAFYNRHSMKVIKDKISEDCDDNELLAKTFLFTEAHIPLNSLLSLYPLCRPSSLKYPQGLLTQKTISGTQFSITRGLSEDDFYGFKCSFQSLRSLIDMEIETFFTPTFCAFDSRWFFSFEYAIDLNRCCSASFDFTRTSTNQSSSDKYEVILVLNFECQVPEKYQEFIENIVNTLRGYSFTIKPTVFNIKRSVHYFKQCKHFYSLTNDNPVKFI